jgi:hypothetical protein
MASQPAQQKKNSKRTKLPGTNKRKQPDELDPDDVFSWTYYKRELADTADPKELYTLAARTKAARNKMVAEAMELQIDSSSGGNKRKYALTGIKADITNKRLYVRRSLPPPPLWGEGPQTSPPSREGTTPLTLAPNLTPKEESTIWRAGQRRQTRQLQHHQHRLKLRHDPGTWNVA